MAHATTYKELDEVRAPGALPEVGVRAGDRGVVVMEYERPEPAIEVEYADDEGWPRVFVVYSPDLQRIFDVHPEKS